MRLNDGTMRLAKLVELTRHNVAPDSFFGRMLKKLDATPLPDWTWGLRQMAWEAWRKLGPAGQRAALGGWRPVEHYPHADEVGGSGDVRDGETERLLIMETDFAGRGMMSQSFVPDDGTTRLVEIRVREGTDKLTALRLLHQELAILEAMWKTGVGMGGDDHVMFDAEGVREAWIDGRIITPRQATKAAAKVRRDGAKKARVAAPKVRRSKAAQPKALAIAA